MEFLLDVTVLFAFVLALALLIERFIEIVTSFVKLLDSRLDWHTYWTKKARKMKITLEQKMNVFEYADPESVARVLTGFRELILNEQGGYEGTIPIISGDLVRAITTRSICKIVAVLIGVWLAFCLKIDFVAIWQNAQADLSGQQLQATAQSFGMILSGIAIGLGSGPVHKIITTIEKRREKQQKKGGTP